MPFINSKITNKITKEQETEIKTRLGQTIALIPGKSEQWLMLAFEPETAMYFRGDNSEAIAFVEVSVYGNENSEAFEQLTAAICNIYKEVLNIAPDHVYVKYETTKNWGWNGANF